MDEVKKADSHMTSAAAFVEGGIQDACDDACSICLEAFCDGDPSTVTSCKHEFHLQCILEWCQRSSNCPMCWQPISLKDPASQELLEAVEQERIFRSKPSRNTTIFHHPTLGDFELQHLPLGVNDPELEDRIMQHLAAAAAMGRTRRIARGDGSRSRSSGHTYPQFVLFSANPSASSSGPVSASLTPSGAETESPAITVTSPSLSLMSTSVQSNHISASSSRSLVMPTTCQGNANDNRTYASESSLPGLDRAGPSEFQSFSDTWKSRLNTMSMKYKESISKSTRGWKEKLFSRSSSMAEIGSEVRREVNAGIATVSHMMEHLEARDNNTAGRVPPADNAEDTSATGHSNHDNSNAPNETSRKGNTASFATSSISS
ncbi:Anaphase-promoting complex (APC), subunit 11 [Handroanthus impetiginosus]|uniref:RING-type E3 ubiquitin transferase n=1 Tax=Handroanthus impetiginosus TaxID=429701 RepID=A0A2G9GEA0_9LAMI|nr:Anaphase-promoting complex (APC), subunit 11 [Handroanthus impetiginosus]